MLRSVTNAMRVIECLVQRGEAGISEVARELDLTVGTVHRIVSTLADTGFVEQNAKTRRYRPGSKIPSLAREMRSRADFLSLGQAVLERLKDATQETANIGVLRSDRVVYVGRVVSDKPLALEVKIGTRVPAYCSALGKAILAWSDDRYRDSYLERLDQLAAEDGRQVPDEARLAAELKKVRARGFAVDHGELYTDIACVGAPVLDAADRAVAGVSVSGPRSRIEAALDELIPMVGAAGQELSQLVSEMGHVGVAL